MTWQTLCLWCLVFNHLETCNGSAALLKIALACGSVVCSIAGWKGMLGIVHEVQGTGTMTRNPYHTTCQIQYSHIELDVELVSSLIKLVVVSL